MSNMIGEKSIPDEATRLINQAKQNNLQQYVPNTSVRAETSLQYYINESQTTRNTFGNRVVKERPKSIFLIFIFYGVLGLLFIHYFLTNNIQDDSEYSDSRLRTPSEDMRGQNGGVAAEHEACSKIGQNMLIKGGSAVDAAIASALCVGVVNSFSSGNKTKNIKLKFRPRGGFMMVRDAKGEIEFIDFRESAPRATNPEVYTKSPISAQVGGLSVGIPGELRGFETAHERHGKLAWKELFEPSILLAREGFPVGAELARYIKEEKDAILASSAMSKIYAKNGTLAKEGDWIFHKNLANTLEKVSNFGSKAFYEGEVASSIINTLRKEGSVMELEDLASYKAIIRTPLTGTFKGHRVIASPLPTSGASLIAVLNIIEGFSNTNNTSQNYHRLTEALKYGFALRTELADPAFTDLTARVEQMISKSYSKELRSNISESRTYDYQHYNPKFENKELPGTTHVSAIAADSSAAAITTTVNLIFGSKIMDPITGILFNDEMDDFSIPHVKNNYDLFPSPANFIAPLKRPLSSTVPTIIELADDGGLLVVGGSGGSRILSAVTQLILNQVDNGLELAASLDFPRLHHQLLPNSIFLEPDFDPLIAKLLESKGHQITWWPKYKSAIQAVTRSSDGSISAVSDSRKKGKAAAY